MMYMTITQVILIFTLAYLLFIGNAQIFQRSIISNRNVLGGGVGGLDGGNNMNWIQKLFSSFLSTSEVTTESIIDSFSNQKKIEISTQSIHSSSAINKDTKKNIKHSILNAKDNIDSKIIDTKNIVESKTTSKNNRNATKNAKKNIETNKSQNSDKYFNTNSRGIKKFEKIRPVLSSSPDYLTSFSILYYSQSSFFGLEDKHIYDLDKVIKNVFWPLNDNESKFNIRIKSIISEPSSRIFASSEMKLETDPEWINSNPMLWKNFESMRLDPKVVAIQSKLVDDYVFSHQIKRILVKVDYIPPNISKKNDRNIENLLKKEKSNRSLNHLFSYIQALILNRVRNDNKKNILLESEFEKAPLNYSSELILLLSNHHQLNNSKENKNKKNRENHEINIEKLMNQVCFEWFLNYLIETSECSSRMNCFFIPLREMMHRVLNFQSLHESNNLVFPIDITNLLANYYMNEYPNKYLYPIVDSSKKNKKNNDENMVGSNIHYDTSKVPSPSVSFNEYKGQSVDVAIRRAIGYTKACMLFGSFEADLLMSELSQIELNIINQVRRWYMKMKFNQSLFRYFIIDPKTCQYIGSEYYKPFIRQMNNDSAFIGHIPVGKHGTVPLVLPGESIVSHQRSEHRYNIIGMYNPSLINYEVSHILENKWMESKFWEYYVPHAMVKSKLLSEMIVEIFPDRKNFTCTVEEFIQVTKKHFPQGWVLKGVNDYASEFKILSSDMDVLKEYGVFQRNRVSFLKFINSQKKGVKGCEENEDLLDVLRPRPEYLGYKLDQFFSKTNEALVQHKLNILREFRVEVMAGRVLEEAVLDRFYFREIPTSPSIGKWVAKFVRDDVLKYLPDALKYMPMTMDIACIRGCGNVDKYNATKSFSDSNEHKSDATEKDFEFKVIEANPGAQSWFSHYHINSIKISNEFLWKYPQLTQKESYLRNPMTPQKQIEFIMDMITNVFRMNRNHHYPLYDFHKHFIEDHNVRIQRIDVDEKKIGQVPRIL